MRSTNRTLVIVLVVLAVVLSAGCIGLGDDSTDDSTDDDRSSDDPSAGDDSADDDSADDEPSGDDASNEGPSPPDDADVEYLENTTADFRTDDGDVTVTLEVAATYQEKYAGLSNRASLPADHGMVFVYDDLGDRTFAMRDTYVPLDIIFLDEDQRVLNIEEADPEPDTPDDDLTPYSSDEPAQYVIELEQGYADEHGIEPGTEVVFDDELQEDEGIVD